MKQSALQLRARRHNSVQGYAAMAEVNMESILRSDTASPDAKAKARFIQADLAELRLLLKTRID